MKKTIIAAALAAMTFAAVSCSDKKEDKLTDNVEETTVEVTISEEDIMRDIAKDSAAEKVDMTAQQIEKYDIPEDWQELSVENFKIYVPSGVEELDADTGMRRFGDESKGLYLTILPAIKYDCGMTLGALNPDLSEEKVKQAFSELGIEYNGTRLSFMKAALSLTSADKTDENAEAFETAILAKGTEFDMDKEILVSESDGHPIYIDVYKDLGLKKEKASIGVNFFIDESTVQSFVVNADTMDEALQIATNLKLA